LTESEINDAYEAHTGDVIVETFTEGRLNPLRIPAVLVSCHGPFTWGKDAMAAADNAAYLEMVAKLALDTLALSPDCPPADRFLLDKHFLRKHGPNAYYGQGKHSRRNGMEFNVDQLTFPLRWHGRLVMKAGMGSMEESVARIFQSLGVTEGEVAYANKSSNGTYETWRLSGMVHDLAMLRALFTALEALPGVRMLI
jgi:putative lipoic acid-binding regulatory protein